MGKRYISLFYQRFKIHKEDIMLGVRELIFILTHWVLYNKNVFSKNNPDNNIIYNKKEGKSKKNLTKKKRMEK